MRSFVLICFSGSYKFCAFENVGALTRGDIVKIKKPYRDSTEYCTIASQPIAFTSSEIDDLKNAQLIVPDDAFTVIDIYKKQNI